MALDGYFSGDKLKKFIACTKIRIVRSDEVDRGRSMCEGGRYVVVLVLVTCELCVLIVGVT